MTFVQQSCFVQQHFSNMARSQHRRNFLCMIYSNQVMSGLYDSTLRHLQIKYPNLLTEWQANRRTYSLVKCFLNVSLTCTLIDA